MSRKRQGELGADMPAIGPRPMDRLLARRRWVYADVEQQRTRAVLFRAAKEAIESKPPGFGQLKMTGPPLYEDIYEANVELNIIANVVYSRKGDNVSPRRVEVGSSETVGAETDVKIRQAGQIDLEQAVLPPAEETAAGVSEAGRPTPQEQEEALLGLFGQLAAVDPDRAKLLADKVSQLADAQTPPSWERNLGMADATRITGLSESRIKQLAQKGRIGSKKGRKRWAFSEAELIQFAETERPPGRPGNLQSPQ